jgi:hypothetical protein
MTAAGLGNHEELVEQAKHAAIVRYDDQAVGPGPKPVDEPTDVVLVEVVGRLVKEKEVWTGVPGLEKQLLSELPIALARSHSFKRGCLQLLRYEEARAVAEELPVAGWSVAGEDVEQGGLADAVAADQSDAIARSEGHRELPEQRPAARGVEGQAAYLQ